MKRKKSILSQGKDLHIVPLYYAQHFRLNRASGQGVYL